MPKGQTPPVSFQGAICRPTPQQMSQVVDSRSVTPLPGEQKAKGEEKAKKLSTAPNLLITKDLAGIPRGYLIDSKRLS